MIRQVYGVTRQRYGRYWRGDLIVERNVKMANMGLLCSLFVVLQHLPNMAGQGSVSFYIGEFFFNGMFLGLKKVDTVFSMMFQCFVVLGITVLVSVGLARFCPGWCRCAMLYSKRSRGQT